MSAVGVPLPCYLVEWYRPGLLGDHLDRIVADLDRSSEAVTIEGSPIRRVLILAVPGDELIFGIFQADSASAVERVCQRAGMPASRLTAAVTDRVHGAQA